MKRIILTLTAVLLLAALPLASVSADNWNWHHTTNIYGQITENGKGLKHVKVEVTCNGHHEWARTNRYGWYDVSFSSRQCGKGSKVTVTASSSGISGENTGRVDRDYDDRINVSLMSVAVPEFGTLTAASAVTIGGVSLLAIRRRSLRNLNI